MHKWLWIELDYGEMEKGSTHESERAWAEEMEKWYEK